MTRRSAHIAAVLCIAFFSCAFFVAARGADAATLSSADGGAVFVEPIVWAPDGAFAGRATSITGHAPAGSGDVTVEAQLGEGPWTAIASATADAAGDFKASWRPFKSGSYSVRVIPANAAQTSSNQPTVGTLSVYRRQKATWYGPGFYGKRTACNVKLTRRTLGVAHRSLPCGSKVELFNAGKTIVVPVIDRGPFVRGVTWDLTLRTMRALGSSETTLLGALPLQSK